MPAWSPNDREMSFISSDVTSAGPTPAPGVWAVDDAGHERLVLDATRDGLPSAIAWSPDGRRLASVLGGEPGTRLGVEGRALTSDGEDVFPFRPEWLSSRELLYTADGVIKRRSVLGGPPATIPFTAKVTLKRDRYTIARRDLEPAGPQRVTGIVSPVVSPDGRFVAFTAVGDLWRLSVGGSAERLTDDSYAENDPAWSPDGRMLAFTSDRDGTMNVWVRDLATGRDRQLTHLHGDNASGSAWSPDGTHIAFLINRTELGTVAVEAGGLATDERSTPPGGRGELGRPTWRADSRAVAVGVLLPYSNRYREGLNQILVHDFGSQAWTSSVIFPERSAGNRQTEGPVWAPDGVHMAFVSQGRLWTVAIDATGAATGPPNAIAGEGADSPSWEGDSRHVVYLTPRGLRRVLADGGPPERIPLDLTWRDAPTPDRVVVHAGRMFDGRADLLQGAHDIVIVNGVIREVVEHRDELHREASVVDASGEVVMPGLIDMHTHLDPDYGAALGRIWLAYGVTSVRNPSVNPYVGLEMREAWDSGRRPGPRLFLSGQAFDGPRTYYPGYLPIVSAGQLDDEIATWSQFPLDFFKTYVRLPDAFQKRIVQYAHGTAGMPVTSHELYPGVEYGMDGVEHLRGTSRRGYSPKVTTTNHSYQDVVDTIVASGMTLTPTIGIQGAFALRVARDRSMADDPRLALSPPGAAATVRELARATLERQAALAHTLAPYGATIKAIAAGGGTIVAGTDSPIFPYGLSLHAELQAYVDAGLTPFQALETATVNAARALGLGDRLGTIEPGRLADLTFLGGDPLADIRETMDVKRVMKGGRTYGIENLELRIRN